MLNLETLVKIVKNISRGLKMINSNKERKIKIKAYSNHKLILGADKWLKNKDNKRKTNSDQCLLCIALGLKVRDHGKEIDLIQERVLEQVQEQGPGQGQELAQELEVLQEQEEEDQETIQE
jgi:hypothetical protein